MIKLEKTVAACNDDSFAQVFKQEVEQLSLDDLPLQQSLSVGSHALADDLKIMINSVEQLDNTIRIRAGIFFYSIIAGCNCADDPTPVDRQSEYCELKFSIDRLSAETKILPY